MCVLVKKDEKIKEDVFWIFFPPFYKRRSKLMSLEIVLQIT